MGYIFLAYARRTVRFDWLGTIVSETLLFHARNVYGRMWIYLKYCRFRSA